MFFTQTAEFEYEEAFVEIASKDVSLPTLVSYVFDWVVYIIILVVSIVYGRFGTPRVTDFDVRNTSIMHVYIPESRTFAPIWALLLLGIFVPCLFIILIGYTVTKLPLCRKTWDIQCALLAIMGGVSCQLFVVCLMKNYTALPRPDFLSRCVPLSFDDQVMGSLSDIGSCVNPLTYNIFEGLRSFPSGHASTVFTTSTIQLLFTSARLNVFDGRGLAIKVLIAIIYPAGVALLISFSRVSDNRHFVMDVVAGSIIGIATGFVFYAIYFPFPFRLSNLGRAYLPRRFGVSYSFCGVGGFWPMEDLPGGVVERTEVPGFYEEPNTDETKESQTKDKEPETVDLKKPESMFSFNKSIRKLSLAPPPPTRESSLKYKQESIASKSKFISKVNSINE